MVQAWELSGDSYSTHPGDKPWISEMYGYSFGAAKANVWHTCHRTAMLYPGYDTSGVLQEVAAADELPRGKSRAQRDMGLGRVVAGK